MERSFNLSLGSSLTTISRNPSTDLIALGGKNTLKVYKLHPNDKFEQQKVLKVSKAVKIGSFDVSWNPKEKNLLASTTIFNPQIILWDYGKKPSSSKIGSHEQMINRISWNHFQPNILASCSQDRTLKLWDIKNAICKDSKSIDNNKISPKPIMKIDSKEKLRDCQFSPKVEWYLLASCINGEIMLFDTRKTAEKVRTFDHFDDVLTVDWHPSQSNVFCSGGMDRNLYIWNIDSSYKKPIIAYSTIHSTYRVKWFDPNPQYIISSYQANNLYASMWNINIHDMPEYKFLGHKDVVTGFCWDTSNTRLITCAKDGTVLVTKFTDGLRLFDKISTSVTKFSKEDELMYYYNAKPQKKPFSECDISELLLCRRNSNDLSISSCYMPDYVDMMNFNKNDFSIKSNPTLSDKLVSLNQTKKVQFTPHLQQYYKLDKDQIHTIFKNYCFILEPENAIRNNRLGITSEMKYAERIRLAIEYNYNYAKEHIKNYNHLAIWDELHMLTTLPSFDTAIDNDNNHFYYKLKLQLKMNTSTPSENSVLFLENIKHTVLGIISYLIDIHNDLVLATIISYLFHPLFESEIHIKKKLLNMEEDCRELLNSSKLFVISAKLKKFGFYEMVKSEHDPVMNFICGTCKVNYDGTSVPACSSCKKQILCFKCNESVTGLYTWCSECGYGGHPTHMYEYFKNNEHCPSLCGEHRYK